MVDQLPGYTSIRIHASPVRTDMTFTYNPDMPQEWVQQHCPEKHQARCNSRFHFEARFTFPFSETGLEKWKKLSSAFLKYMN